MQQTRIQRDSPTGYSLVVSMNLASPDTIVMPRARRHNEGFNNQLT